MAQEDIPERIPTFEEEVSPILKEVVDSVIGPNTTYNHSKVGVWVNQIVEGCMKEIRALPMPRKYIVNCTILQQNGAGLHAATSCFWDNEADTSCTCTRSYKTLVVITTVYGLQL
eukprot:RCo036309